VRVETEAGQAFNEFWSIVAQRATPAGGTADTHRRARGLQNPAFVWSEMAALVDVAHAMLMAAWILGLPLLFWHRWPRVSAGYAVYATAFVVLNRLSQWYLGECFLTTAARHFWKGASAPARESDEWFTVRFARWVFGLTPSHRVIAVGSELLILITAIGALVFLHRTASRRHARRRSSPANA
jgi:hypothetical protein